MYRDLEEYLEEVSSALKGCKVEYYRIHDVSPETIRALEAELRRKCGEHAYFQIFGRGIIITPRTALASLIRLRRANRRGRRIARKTYIEYLLRTLGTRKISWSIEASGAVGEGERTVVLVACGGCDPGDLGGIARRVSPGEAEVLEGMGKLASLCLEGTSPEKMGITGVEDLEKILLTCGARIEVEG